MKEGRFQGGKEGQTRTAPPRRSRRKHERVSGRCCHGDNIVHSPAHASTFPREALLASLLSVFLFSLLMPG